MDVTCGAPAWPASGLRCCACVLSTGASLGQGDHTGVRSPQRSRHVCCIGNVQREAGGRSEGRSEGRCNGEKEGEKGNKRCPCKVRG